MTHGYRFPRFLAGQSGALFGIDARIALALFGILSVIAGYVAFGRLTASKQAVLLTELEAFETAFQQYQADTGTFYLFTLNKPVDDTSSIDDIKALWDKSMVKSGFAPLWNGPYVHRETAKSRFWGTYSVFYAQPDRHNYCTTDSACDIFLSLNGVPENLWQAINAHYDQTNNRNEQESNPLFEGRLQADADRPVRTLILRIAGRPAGGITP